jgi:hypothetical protein
MMPACELSCSVRTFVEKSGCDVLIGRNEKKPFGHTSASAYGDLFYMRGKAG